MKNGIFEVIKTNKKAIFKKALIIGGAIAGLVIVTKMVKSKNDEEETVYECVETTDESSNETIEENG